jgi:hypothetical protein
MYDFVLVGTILFGAVFTHEAKNYWLSKNAIMAAAVLPIINITTCIR